MPIRIDPVCRNCRGAIEPDGEGVIMVLNWIHSEPAIIGAPEWCHPSHGLAIANPIIRVVKMGEK